MEKIKKENNNTCNNTCKIMIMNAGASSRKKTQKNNEKEEEEKNKLSITDKKKKIIYDIIINTEPDLVFLQEFTWTNITNKKTWKITGEWPNKYSLVKSGTSILYNQEKINTDDIKSSLIFSTLENLQEKQIVSKDFSPMSRICLKLCKIKHTQKEYGEILFISWHGKHRGMTLNNKIKGVKDLVIFIKEIIEKFNRDHKINFFIIGGDFNVSAFDVDENLKEFFTKQNVKILFPPIQHMQHKGNKKIIDFFITSNDDENDIIKFKNFKSIVTTDNEEILKRNYNVLDHEPILIEFCLL